MSDAAAVALELRTLRDEVAALRRAVERLAAPAMSPLQRRAFGVAAALYRPGDTITAGAMVQAAALEPKLHSDLRAVCGADPQRLGIVLGQLADLGAMVDGMRLVRLPKEAGARRWTLEGAEPL